MNIYDNYLNISPPHFQVRKLVSLYWIRRSNIFPHRWVKYRKSLILDISLSRACKNLEFCVFNVHIPCLSIERWPQLFTRMNNICIKNICKSISLVERCLTSICYRP